MFVNVENISLAKPSQVEKGSLLIGNAQGARASVFAFEFQNQIHAFELANPNGQPGGFQATTASEMSRRYLMAKDFKVEVDISEDSKIDPTRGNILPGQVVMSDRGPCFALQTKRNSTIFISTSGVLMADIEEARVLGFSRWRITIPGPLETAHTIYEAGNK